MRTVDITYRSLFGRRNIHIDVPERWEDLKPYQFEVCAQLHIAPPTDEEFIRRFFRLKKRVISKLTKFEIFRLTDMVSFAVKPAATTSHFFMEEIPGTALKAPAGKLGNITLEHFALLDTYFFKYVNQPTDQRLSEFIASVYLKKNEILTRIDFTARVKYVSKHVDKYSQYAIFLNYLFVRKWLACSFKFLFDDSSNETTMHKRKTEEKPVMSLPRWVEIIDNFVGEDILKYDEYTSMNCIRAFKAMNYRIKNYRKNGK